MLLIADKEKICLTRKEINHMSNDGFAIDFNEGFGDGIPRLAKALPETRHWNDDLHKRSVNKH